MKIRAFSLSGGASTTSLLAVDSRVEAWAGVAIISKPHSGIAPPNHHEPRYRLPKGIELAKAMSELMRFMIGRLP